MKLARSITHKVAWSTVVQTLGKLVQIAIGVIIVRWVTRSLEPEAFGQYSRIAEYVMFFSVAANLGIFGNVVRKMADAPKDGELFTNALGLRMGLSLIFFSTGALITLFWGPSPAFISGMLFLMASLLFDHLTSICNAALQANYWMGRSVFAMTIARLIELGVVAFLAQHTSSMPLFFLAPLAASACALGLTLFFIQRRFTLQWTFNKALMKELLWTALPFGVINIINNLYFRFLPSYFMGRTLTDEQFSFYSLSLGIAMTASLFSTFLMFSVLPSFKHSLTEGHTRRARNMFHLAIVVLGAGAILMVLCGSFLAPWTIEMVSGKNFWRSEIAILYPLLLILAALSYFYDLILITIFALEKEFWLLKRECIALILGTAVMSSSIFILNTNTSVIVIIAGALVAELFLVTVGLNRIRQWLR